uniref:Reverse transcriptase domain, reverse transcriptase zinc-binding domain protein n=1 Tax=Tanacetum cinerariifolium TaxID=118510 RepID=A0A6L2L4I5_TANCI|nr:reverse transcriptase domain, reverse transcriptase zinc-binding domain protein [Tanacetum cinerariifolium]
MDEEEVNKLNYLNKYIIQQENEVRLDGDDVLPDVAYPNTVMKEVTARDIAMSGFSLTSKVRECIHGGMWSWPNDWLVKYPILSSIPVSVLNDAKLDVLEWRNSDGSFETFSVQRVWETIRPRDNEVPWYDLVWFSSCIPRHAVHMWLIMKKRLKTQDALSSWNVVAGLTVVCPLCETQPDSQEHLFFDCPFSHQIWIRVKQNAGLSASGSSLDSIVLILMPIAKRKSFKSCIGKLTLAAAAYFVWQERNLRLFKNSKRSIQEVVDCVMSSVRLKLLSCRFKKSKDAICKEIYDETNFKERFDKIDWNMFIEPLKFEEKWSELIEDFGLQSHKWLTKMFNLREIWIPSYFIDSPLYGLMRTTSRSESENSFFKSFTSPGATLVSFMMSYESAMERQRYRQEALDFKTIETAPKCETKLAIELHAA